MSLNHHLLAKVTTDSVLERFKTGAWQCVEDAGPGFYRVGCDSTFPSPDAAFYNDSKRLLVSFEFKPPTETKRGVLTGLGQSIVYLNSSNLSYLVIPQRLEDYDIGGYMTDVFKNRIDDNLPVGLIIYENNIPANVALVHNISGLKEKEEFKGIINGRFWAKHLDMPVPLFHLILQCYYLKRIGTVTGDAFEYCWKTYLVPQSVLDTLTPVEVKDINGNVIETLGGRKKIMFLQKKLAKIGTMTGASREAAIVNLQRDAAVDFVGDNYYNSIKKNFVTFLKHIGVVDSTGNITELGIKLYHLGLVNGPTSRLFFDYFTQVVLTVGHHLDLIFDVDSLCNDYRGRKTIMAIRKLMMAQYEQKGMIKRNPGRRAGATSDVEFLKYEFILWNALGLLVRTKGIPEYSFNWKKITEVCSLPDL